MPATIYLATNQVNGKHYVGFTTKSVRYRRQMHQWHAHNGSPFAFHCALRKYGEASFQWTTLETCEDADHALGGIPQPDRRHNSPGQRTAVAQLTLAFWDAYLLGDPAAKSWLASITDRVGSCPMMFAWK